ncbi:penicillin acylase family protein [Flavobacterium johnsoniae]|uniref:Peptidase S45, penicillin amidase n=1 Tax=Flavobacterium johnsoniae (strain ATCC 17061 / DSM 2064 / JCM 8514 / BCRC 14874 / CCUG 350202 / NBRC 14942 / NCIMB 11054 / UW101) TaxID=376686 RepID=A5FMN7_FLAJ1|nr:penicillin acylase family protein [Flavobacterium johnsoniae]ABQ03537.1 peptidase S45, penicillin amidase [Flavobacterium johnsoniae UW101]OXE95959.1 penicillin acylase family protein [Flavobacterium johnsoniae UW101]WQG79598.1 penicillin acylase family protein [Flavobacterium johnsoniae UW101]SHL95118.1 penicillin amidase [Flavobacterium johnsoniae]
MRRFKKFLLVLLVLIVVLAIALFAYIFHLKPKYEGELQLKNLEKETTVYFDEYGVPHIYADSEKDAMTALGYVHAQERLWQMELLRRIAPGKLSEIFGSVALKNDKFFAGIGIEEASAKAIAKLDKNSESYKLTQAYLDGINQYLEEGTTPIEFTLVGVKKEKFTIKDVYNIFGYMSFSFAMAQKTDPLLTDIKNKYGVEYLKDLGIEGEFNTTQIKSSKENIEDYAAVSKSITALLDKSPIPPFIGSNSWVAGPHKTKSGKVIFANDPHIGFSQPATWYEAHIVTPKHELYGCYLAGTPFPLLAHNRDYAYGLTMFENDDIDFYQEKNKTGDSNQYQTPEGFAKYEIRKKTIKIKDTSDVVLTVKSSRHGPIMNDLLDRLDRKNPIAMLWTYTNQPIQILDAAYGLSHAKNRDEFKKSISLIAAPGLNVMYGDAKGNVGWWASGKLYKHDKGVNTHLILDGSSGKDDIKEYLDFSKNPSAENPEWGYVYSANNQPEAIDGFLYPGYYLPEDRAKRISGLMDAKSDWDKEAFSKMIYDNTSDVSVETVQNLILNIDLNALSASEKEAVNVLKSWKGTNNLEDVAPTIYNKWVYLYLKNTFEDEMGEDNFNMFLGVSVGKQVVANQIKNENSVWWDNIKTKNVKETRKDIVSKSFHEAVSDLQKQLGNTIADWKWGEVHTVEHEHPLGKVAALRGLFNVGPFASPGSNEVINNLFFGFTNEGKYYVKGGPSTRRIVDFSDVENSWSILPTGQSGNPFSKHYSDQAEMYNTGKFRKMKLNKDEIIKTSTKLVLKPKM